MSRRPLPSSSVSEASARRIARLLAAAVILVGSACGGGGATSDAMAADASPSDGACGLLKLAEVKRVLPDVASSERDRSLDQYGISSCVWKDSKGARDLTVQHWEGEDSAATELNSLIEGIVDPLRRDALGAIRREKIAGLGDEAIAVVERADEKRGLLTYAALLVVKRGKHVLTFSSSDLALLERTQALKALDSLGRAAIVRVK